MKAYFTLALLLFTIALRAQDYSFGKVSKEELKKRNPILMQKQMLKFCTKTNPSIII